MGWGPFSLAFYAASFIAYRLGDALRLLGATAEGIGDSGLTLAVLGLIVCGKLIWTVRSLACRLLWW